MSFLSKEQISALDPQNAFLKHYRTEYLRFLQDNPPHFQKKAWTSKTKSLSIRFYDGATSKETKNILDNNHLPEGLKGNSYVFLEIKNPDKRKTVVARIDGLSILSNYGIIAKKKQDQNILLGSDLNLLDIIALNYCRILGNPNDFLTRYESVSATEEKLVYSPKSTCEVGEMEISTALLMIPPNVIDTIDETFTYSYDPKTIEEGTSGKTGAHTTITYKQKDKDGNINQTPWRIKISNYKLEAGKNGPVKKGVINEHIDLAEDQLWEICSFIEQESCKDYLHKMNLARYSDSTDKSVTVSTMFVNGKTLSFSIDAQPYDAETGDADDS